MRSSWWPWSTSSYGGTRFRGSVPAAEEAAQHPVDEDVQEYKALDTLLGGLRANGFEACELIVGIDFTKSNKWTGKNSFGGRCLHEIGGEPNPYVLTLEVIAKRLEVYDDDHRIPCYGFGDVTTGRNSVFSFYPNNEPARGLDDLLKRYKEITPSVKLSGPTTFAPLIRQAMREVYASEMRFHMLLILADGQISAECLDDTTQAIVEAASFPLSIVMIGIGDGPWEAMKRFDEEKLPQRRWDNFHFFELNRIVAGTSHVSADVQGEHFEEMVLTEISDQFTVARELTGEQNLEAVGGLLSAISPNTLIDPPQQGM